MRLIDADAYADEMSASTALSIFAEAYLVLNKQPTIDAVPVVHGHWIYRKHGWAECSKCHHNFLGVSDLDNADYYCRHCGAKMDGEVNLCG